MATETVGNPVDSPSPIKLLNEFARRTKVSRSIIDVRTRRFFSLSQVLLDYQLENESGPAHSKTFTVRLRFGEKEYLGTDRSIKLAQRAAAKVAVEDQKELFPPKNQRQDQPQRKTRFSLRISTRPRKFVVFLSASASSTVLLNTWAAQNRIPTRYVLIHVEFLPPSSRNEEKRSRQIFFYRLFIGDDFSFDGQGFSHVQARQNCAFLALNSLRATPVPVPIESFVQVETKSPITLMYERARQLGLTVEMETPSNTTVVLRIGNEFTSTATGATKQEAKRLAAEKLLETLPSPPVEKRNAKRTTQHRKFVEQRGSLDYGRTEEINPITRVYQIGQARHVRVEFRQVETESTEKPFHFVVEFGEEHRCDGFATSKQGAKRLAAETLLAQLNRKEGPMKSLLKRDETSTNEKKHVHFLVDETTEAAKDENRSAAFSVKQQLIKSCERFRIRLEFEDEPKTNDDEQAKSILSLFSDERLLAKFRGQAPTIKRAQENASTAAWKNLRDLFNGSIPTPKSEDSK